MSGETLGKYRLLRPLATGGMGEVFLADQEGPSSFRRRVVVKRLLRHLASDPGFIEMFFEEARVAALIAHPNVVQIIELGEASGTPFIAMEYVRGRSLREVLRSLRKTETKMPPLVAVAIMIDVLHGLHAAHTLVDEEGNLRGCVHRDVSAENVLVSTDGAVKLVDFGIAKAITASTARGTQLRGKYGYMAPEQYERSRLDARTDIFAAGILLFELLTGDRPFIADHEAGIMHAIMLDAPPRLTDIIACPERLREIFEEAVAKEPSARFASAAAMASALEALVASGELGADAGTAVREFARSFGDPPSAVTLAGTAQLGPETAPLTTTVVEPPPKRRRALVAGAVIVPLSVALAVVLSIRHAPPSHAAAAPVPSAEVSAAISLAPVIEPPPAASVAVAEIDAGTTRRARHTTSHVAVPAGVGMLAFRIRPWAEIVVDGRSVGISPMDAIELPAGRHQVVLRNKNLDKERSLTTQIVRGETTTLRVDLME